MTPKGQKKTYDNGAFCGLRSDTPMVPPKSPRPSLTTKNAQVTDQPVAPVIPSPRPQSLTLPFQNRDRASHLISDEEFDKIMRQGELDNPLPRPKSGIPSHLSGLSIRRSASAARGPKTSLFAQRPRPASANFGNTILGTAQHAQDAFPRPGFSRDPTLTALPRPPTKNDMAVYPSQSNINPLTATSDPIETTTNDTAPTATSRSQTNVFPTFSTLKDDKQDNRKGHKRQFSLTLAAASMVDSAKKRIKRVDSPAPRGMRISAPTNFTTQTNRNSQIMSPYDFPSSPNYVSQVYTDTDANSEPITNPQPKRNSTPAPTFTSTTPSKLPTPTSAKTLLNQTWSLTKDTAKETTKTFITPITRIIHKPKGPTFVEVFPPTRRTTIPSTLHTHPSNTNISTTQSSLAFFPSAESPPFAPGFSTAPPVAASRPQPWRTLPREVLGSEIERLEDRTMELVEKNEGYTREIEYLRARVSRLEAAGAGAGSGSGGGSGNKTGTVRRRSAVIGGGEMSRGRDGDGDGDEEMEVDDKRKTWMTCHSDEDEE